MLFSYSTLPSYISWIQNLSWLMYSTEALSIIQWVDVHNISKCEAFFTVSLDTAASDGFVLSVWLTDM
jgi:hypothetical protein